MKGVRLDNTLIKVWNSTIDGDKICLNIYQKFENWKDTRKIE